MSVVVAEVETEMGTAGCRIPLRGRNILKEGALKAIKKD
jgi:hypothetical protein